MKVEVIWGSGIVDVDIPGLDFGDGVGNKAEIDVAYI
jgi:hypothetical protein